MAEVERMEEDMMVIIKVIAEVELVSEAEVGEEVMEGVMVAVITTKPKSKIGEIMQDCTAFTELNNVKNEK